MKKNNEYDKYMIYYIVGTIFIIILLFNPALLILLPILYFILRLIFPSFNEIMEGIIKDTIKSYNIGSLNNIQDIKEKLFKNLGKEKINDISFKKFKLRNKKPEKLKKTEKSKKTEKLYGFWSFKDEKSKKSFGSWSNFGKDNFSKK